jgi:hypothetical protein
MMPILKKAAPYSWVLFVIMAYVIALYLQGIYTMALGRLVSVDSLIVGFVEDFGRMPESQDELVAKGYLKREDVDGHAVYYKKNMVYDRPVWNGMNTPLDEFHISYGARKEDFVVRDGILIDRQTGKSRHLVTGPYDRAFGPSIRLHYERISQKWFFLMRDPSEEETKGKGK